jgi:hypothetical protein
MEAGVKATMIAIFIGGCMVAAFYLAYVLLLLIVIGGVGLIAYAIIKYFEVPIRPDIHD